MYIRSILLVFLATALAIADTVTIHNVTAIPIKNDGLEPKLLTVKFDTPPPNQNDAENSSKWFAVCFPDSTNSPAQVKINTATHRANSAGKTLPFSTSPTITLEFEQDVTTNCSMVEVTFLADKSPSQRWTKKKDKNGQGSTKPGFFSELFSPAKGSDNPDYSISGTVVPAVGSGPLYSLDASLQPRILKGSPSSLVFSAKAKTDSSHKADLDSFSWSLDYRHFPAFPLGETLSPAGMEFNKTGDVMNFISGGSLVWTHFRSVISEGKPVVTAGLDLRAGVELGDNFKNTFTIANHPNQRGSGFIFRSVPSARFVLVIPTSNPKHEIQLSSNYTVRLPARDELFLETRLHTKDPVPLLGTNPRHYIENNLTFKLTEFFSFKVQHSYGSLPPSFKFTDQRGSVGIVFQANQP